MTLLVAVIFAIVVALLMAVAMWFGRYLLLRQHTNVLAKQLSAASEFVGHRLAFRPPEPADRSFYLEMVNDPTAAIANGWSPMESRNVEARFDDPVKFGLLQQSELVAVVTNSSVPVATVTFSTSPLDREGARSIGVQVHPDWRGQGYGRDAMAGAIVFLRVEDQPIHVGTRTTNVGMRKIMEQLGYEPFDTTTAYHCLLYTSDAADE